MAIAFDASTPSDAVNPGTSVTFSHTCTGTNRALVVGVTGDTSTNDVNSVTYGGTAMTKVNTTLSNRYVNIWYLENPASGANNVVVTADSNHYIQASALSYTGVRQSGGRDSTAQNAGTTTSLTVTTTTVADNCWLVMVGKGQLTFLDAGAGTTRRLESATTQGFDSNGAKTPAGSHSLIATGESQLMGMALLSMAPAPDPISDGKFMTTNTRFF